MIIEQILNDKGRDVVTVYSDQTLSQAAVLLDERRIGAVVAIDRSAAIAGVLSERDIVRQIARYAAGALDMPVSEAMTRAVISIEASLSVDDALQLMTDRRVRHLPVLRDGALTGVVSIGDLVKWKIATTEAEAEAMKSYLDARF